jgi:iron complex outermembrane receptor protein
MRKSALLAGACLVLLTTPAFAQGAPAEAAPDVAKTDNGGLAEIVVTATKRESNLQSVPVAVTALTAETLQNQRIAQFNDLTRAAASLTLTEATASPNNSIILRGIGTYAFSIGVEPSVAVIVDDVPVVQQAQAFDSLSDVQRIEVLRGPQGTLFGKNASAGAINIVTKDPGKTMELTGQFTAATDNYYKADAAISAPLGDNAGFRLSGYYGHWDGNVTNLTNGHKLNDRELYGVHGKLKFELSPRFTAVLNAGYSEQKQKGTAATLRSIDLSYIPPGKTTPVVPMVFGLPFLPALNGITPGTDNYAVRYDNDSFTSNKQYTLSAHLNYDLGFASLISVTSYQDWKYNFSNDVDGTDLDFSGLAPAVTKPNGPGKGITQSGPYHSTEFTQELRLTSRNADPLSYVIGAFYANAATMRGFTRGPGLALADWQGYQGTRSLAAFAGLDYTLPTKTTISGAVRVNNERVQDNFTNLLPNATVYVSPTSIGTCGAGSANCAGRNVDTVATFKASIKQELAPRVSVYASVATGYKGFAYDISSGYTPLRTANPVQPEHSTSYEVGLKSRFFDNKLQFNLTGFLTNYNNFQAQSSQFINGALQQKLNNVGKLRTKGFELEIQARPVEWLRIDGSAAYTDAKVISFPDAACYPGQAADQALKGLTGPEGINFCGATSTAGLTGVFQDRSGSQLPNSPKFKFNLGATVEQDLGGEAKGTIGINYQHQSQVSFDLLGDPLLVQKAYGIFNGSIGVEYKSIKITGFVTNLFNQRYVASLTDVFGTTGVHTVIQFQPRDTRRYFGISIAAKY